MASSSVSTSSTESTGPKTSSCIAGSFEDWWRITVGPNQKPLIAACQCLPSKRICPPCPEAAARYPDSLATAAVSMTGPISPGFWPALREAALATSLSKKAFRPLPTTRSTEAAMHRCPAEPKAEFMMSEIVMSSSQSGIAMRWFLAPPIHNALLPVLRAVLSMISATRELPTNETAAMPGCSDKALATPCAPCTMEKTPLGSPASASSSAIRINVKGTFSEGLMMKQLPQPIAIGSVHNGTIAGKLKGTMEATTPSGRRTSWHHTPRATSKSRPAIKSGRPVAKATVSSPFRTSASASPRFLPCSWTTKAVSSAKFASHRALNRKRTSARALTGVSLQAGKAAAAALTA
mmetsp:Transcript_4569/g.10696  ORF Transcript_4569/g.10696 Transcript_4569/m.10696 type:complete len:350 (+) Transcript_4569:573-1622(+)